VWSAPWCGPCKKALPELESELNKHDHSQVDFIVYVVSGQTNGSKCTDAVAKAYANHYAPSAKPVCDTGGKVWKEMTKRNLGGIPSGLVVVDGAQTVYSAGAGFSPQEMVQESLR